MRKAILLAVLIFAVPGLAQIPSGYVSYWKFDDDLTDESGTNNGTFIGGTEAFTSGVDGQGVVLSGATKVDVGNDASLDFSGSFSIGGWVYLKGRGSYHKMVDKSTWNTGFFMQQAGPWPSYWNFHFRGGNEIFDTQSVQDQFDSWLHYMCIYDGAVMYLYRDGALVESVSSGPMTATTASLKFGSVNAVLDEMIFYTRALTETEIGGLMSATRDTTPPVITGIQAEQLPGYNAMVTFTTDQTSYGTVEYTRDSVIAEYDHKSAFTSHNVLINGLIAADQWYYRIRATNLQGYATVSPWETLSVQHTAANQKFSLNRGSASTRPVTTDLVWPSAVGDADVCMYPDDKTAAVTLTIDDNSAIWDNHAMWVAWGDTFDMKFTWFVNTAGIGPGGGNAGDWPDWRYLYSLGHAVQSHSHTHGNTTLHTNGTLNWMEDYGKCKAWVEENIPGDQCVTMAYPGGAFANEQDTAMNYYIAGRGTYAVPNGKGRFNYKSTNCSSSWNMDHVRSVLNKTTTIYGTNYRRGWACFIVHSVKDSSRYIFRDFLSFLDGHRDSLWVGTYPALIKYNQSYHTHDLEVTAVTDSMISFTLADSMLDTIYNEALTVKVRIDNSWDTCIAMQGQTPVEAEVVEHDGNQYALVKAVPDRGEVVLSTDGQTTGMALPKTDLNVEYRTLNVEYRMFSMTGQQVQPGQKREPGVYLIYDGKTLRKTIILK